MSLSRAVVVPRPAKILRTTATTTAAQPFSGSHDPQSYGFPAAAAAAGAPRNNDGSSPRTLRLLLVGSPGAGKGTQSARIRKKFPFVAVSSGDILRRNIQNESDIGRLAQKAMAKGDMVSDRIMVDLISNELASLPHTQHLLLDGFPRSVAQAKAFDEKLDLTRQPLNLVINLHVPTAVILQRIMDRWVHIPSGRVYNESYNPPRVPGYDDVTGEKLVRRPDDDPDVFCVRMEKHLVLTQPLLEYYEKRDILVNLSGNTSDEIYPQIEAEIIKRITPPAPVHHPREELADNPKPSVPCAPAVGDGIPAAVPIVQLA